MKVWAVVYAEGKFELDYLAFYSTEVEARHHCDAFNNRSDIYEVVQVPVMDKYTRA